MAAVGLAEMVAVPQLGMVDYCHGVLVTQMALTLILAVI